MEVLEIKLTHLKTLEEYKEELNEIQRELEVGIDTDTLIESDLELLTRLDEITLILIAIKYLFHDKKEGEPVEEVRS